MLAESSETALTKREEEGRGSRLPYLPGLDGLRALAVLVVLLYHSGAFWAPGGFLGVEIFFVISGYLITSLLLAEWSRQGRVNLKAFWLRRARRLLPAVFLLLIATLGYAILFLPEEVASLRGDVLAAMGYVTNWYLIFSHQSYFEAVGRPSLLRHLWSLAVEEQFYLLWPLLFSLGMWRLRGGWRMLTAVLLTVAGSTVLMALLFQPDVDPSRVYYGTDTRAAGMLLGAALAYVWSPARPPQRVRGWQLEAAGVFGLGALGAACALISEFQPFLYRGGFLLVSLATLVVVAVVVHPKARFVPAALGIAPLRWVGLRSYGIYLWHWPVFMLTRPQLDLPLDGLPLLALRFVATGILAEISYRFVETPIRTGALGRGWAALRQANGGRRLRLGLQWGTAATALVALLVVLGVSAAGAKPPPPPEYLAMLPLDDPTATPTVVVIESTPTATPAALPTLSPAAATAAPATTSPTPAATASAETPAVTVESSTATPTERPAPTPTWTATPTPTLGTATPTPMPPQTASPATSGPPTATGSATPVTAYVTNPWRGSRVTAIGDSVMMGAVRELQRVFGDVDIDVSLGRSVPGTIDLLKARRAAGQLGSVVVIHVGNNGIFTAAHLDETMRALADAEQVIFVNDKVPRQWERPNNLMLAEQIKYHPKAVLVDWNAESSKRPELFWDDGMHLRPDGAKLYADLIAAQVKPPAPAGLN